MSKKKSSLVFAMLVGALLAFPVTGCGGDDDGDEKINSGANDNNNNGDGKISADNWQSTLRDTYGVEMSLPTGWTFSSAKSMTVNESYPEHEIYFTTQEADFQAAYEVFVAHLFAATEAVTPADGNYSANSLWPFEKGDRLESAPPLEIWYFTQGNNIVQVVANDNETSRLAGFSIMYSASKKNW